MVNTYNLINPYIQGKFKSEIKAKNSLEAANIFYTQLSQHFNNSVPEFNFSIQKGVLGNGKYSHFQVRENRKNDEVNFSINPIHIDESNLSDFQSKLNNFKSKFNQDGGEKKKKKIKKKSKKKHSESSSDSESSIIIETDNIYKRVKKYLPVNQPIYYWWYDPYIYSLNSVYIPTFYSYVTPYIELSLSL
jgi:hypothetical protein